MSNDSKQSMRAVRSMMIVAAVMLMIIVAIVLSLTSFLSTRRVVTKVAEEQLLSAAKLGVEKIEGWIGSHIAQVEEMARSSQIQSLSRYEINDFLGERLKELGDYSSFWLSDMEGNWYSPLGTAGSIAQRAYFPEVVQKKDTVISNPLIGQADGQLTVVLAVPVKINGEMRAILGANLKVSELVNEVNSIRVGTEGYASLYEQSGLTVIHKDAKRTLEYNPFLDVKHPLNAVREQVLENGGASVPIKYEGRDLLVLGQKMKLTGWVMVTLASESEFMRPLYEALILNCIGTVIMITAGAIFVFVMASRITRPLAGFGLVIGAMRGGDMTVSSGITNAKGSLAKIVSSLDDVREHLREMIVRTNSSVEAVARDTVKINGEMKIVVDLAEKTSAGSRDILENSSKNAQTASMITDAVSEISSSISKVDDSMRSIEDSADRTVDLADSGNREVLSVIEQMTKIKNAVGQASNVITSLGESSRRIGEIVAAIASISKQTNLLAVNASIEAARAGEQGRGFAVVAGEVGKLARETNDATESISALAVEMEERASKAIESIETGSQEVAVGTDVVQTAGRIFADIQNIISSLRSQLKEITNDVNDIASQRQGLIAAAEGIEARVKNTAAKSEAASDAMAEQLDLITEMRGDIDNLTELSKSLSEDVKVFRT